MTRKKSPIILLPTQEQNNSPTTAQSHSQNFPVPVPTAITRRCTGSEPQTRPQLFDRLHNTLFYGPEEASAPGSSLMFISGFRKNVLSGNISGGCTWGTGKITTGFPHGGPEMLLNTLQCTGQAPACHTDSWLDPDFCSAKSVRP